MKLKLTAEQAKDVLDTLIAQGRVRLNHIQRVLKGRLEIQRLRRQLDSLERLVGRAVPARTRRRARRKVRRTLSAKTRELRRQQGKYMGYVRNLKASEKARVKSVRVKQGIEAAIKLAASLGSK